jgi:hypothetical protein
MRLYMQVMHLLEKDNPLLATPDGDHYYKSIPAAMWPTLLNLAGEVPLADFTLGGRVVCGDMDAPCLDAHAYDGLVHVHVHAGVYARGRLRSHMNVCD